MKITLGVLAHVDAGKTTFSESLLYFTNTIAKKGRVDHQSSHLDSHELEKARGITIFTDQAVIDYCNNTYYLIDTPGHIDFSPEMERAIKIMDYAIIILSAVEGVEGHTETVWQLLQKHQIPTFFFINKTDRAGANVNKVFLEIQQNISPDSFLLSDLNSKEFYEFVAMYDEQLLELYVNENFTESLWLKKIARLIKDNKICLCQSGSALKDEGVLEFFDNINQLVNTNYQQSENFSCRVFKISHDVNGAKITHLKVLSGMLKVRDEIEYTINEQEVCEKVTSIREYNGLKYITKKYAQAGDVVAITGLNHSVAGLVIGDIDKQVLSSIQPTLKSRVLFEPTVNVKEVVKIFYLLYEEDPTLNVEWNEQLQELSIQVMGPIQLEVLQTVIEKRFNLKVGFEKPKILYKESINGIVKGYGHYEPYRHYAEVHLQIKAGKRNSGVIFNSECHVDLLNKGSQNLVKQHVLEKAHKGLLTGSPLTDVEISLINGRIHKEHTSGGDLKEATLRALRQGLEKADNVLLEPYYSFKIKVDNDDMGRVMADIQKRNGEFQPPEILGNKTLIQGQAPVSCFMDYPLELRSFTSGKAMIQLVFSGYKSCHNASVVINDINYNKDADREYSSASVFCGKGKTYNVPWHEAEQKMHCDKA